MNALYFLFFFSLISALATEIPGRDLLNYFSATCPSQGEWTKIVLSDSDALVAILNNIKEDPECSASYGALSQFGALAQKVEQLQQKSDVKLKIEMLNAQEIELLNQMNQTSDPLLLSQLQLSMGSLQLQKANLVVQLKYHDDFKGNINESYSLVIQNANNIYSAVANNTQCINKNPKILTTITSTIAQIASSFASINPALGLGLAAASDFLGQTVESLRVSKINRKIRQISVGSSVNLGFKCVLESLSNRWCELSDAKNFLDFKAKYAQNSSQNAGLLSALRIYDRKLPTVLEWLQKVKSGTPAANEYDSKRHSDVFKRLEMVQSARSLGDGIISSYKSLYEAQLNPKDKYNVIKIVVSKLTNNCPSSPTSFGGTTVKNPLEDINNGTYAPFYLLGLDSIPQSSSGFPYNFCTFDPFVQWPVGNPVYVPNYELIVERYREWIELATSLVNKEFTLAMQPDALGVISLAYENTGNSYNEAPHRALAEIIKFLTDYPPRNLTTSNFKALYDETVQKLTLIADLLEQVTNPKTPITPQEAIQKIFNTADLQYGTIVIESRLQMIIRISLHEYFEQHGANLPNIASQLLAAESYLDVLRKISGKDNDILIMLDLQNSMRSALGNMESFVNVFAKNINRILKFNQEKIKKLTDRSQAEIYQMDQNKICLLLSTMPTIPKEIDYTPCLGTQIAALSPNGPAAKLLTTNYFKANFTERSCGYREFIRKSKIYQKWGIKL